MKPSPLLLGGMTAGLIVVAGDAVLNLVVPADDWVNLFARFSLPQPSPLVAAQGLLKLLILGAFLSDLRLNGRPQSMNSDLSHHQEHL